MTRRDTGILGEKIARAYLKELNYRIIETNYWCPEGEIDIIAEHYDYTVFVEVRTKRSTSFGSPEASITPAKKKRMRASAYYYCQAHDNLSPCWRIDMVAIELDYNSRLSRIEVIENAVEDE